MAVTLDDVHRMVGSDVFDSKGQRIGVLHGPHVLDGELVGLHVRLDERLATLPTVGRDDIEFAPEHVETSGANSLRLRVDLMDAVGGRAPPRDVEAERAAGRGPDRSASTGDRDARRGI